MTLIDIIGMLINESMGGAVSDILDYADTLNIGNYLFIQFANCIWNCMMDVAVTLLTATPSSFSPEAYNVMLAIAQSPYMLGLAGGLISVLFIYGLCARSIDIRAEIKLDNLLWMYVKLCICEIIIVNYVPVLNSVCSAASALIQAVSGTAAGHLQNVNLTTSFTAFSGFTSFLAVTIFSGAFFLVSVVYMIVILLCAGNILYVIAQRFLKLYIGMPFGAVALATVAGTGTVTESAKAYIKFILCFVVEGVVILLSIYIGTIIIGSMGSIITQLSDSVLTALDVGIADIAQLLLTFVTNMFFCVFISASVRNSENIARRLLAL